MKNIFKNLLKKIRGGLPSYKISERESKKRIKDIFTKDIVAKALCVFAAIILWFYVIDLQGTTFEKTFSKVPVNLLNVSSMQDGLSVVSGYDNYVDVVLAGRKSDINKIRAGNISAYVDLSGIQSAGDYLLNIVVSTPPNTAAQKITPGSIYVYVDKTITKQVEIKTSYTGGTNDNENLIIGNLIPSSEFVSVTGPEEKVRDISHALVNVSLGIIDKSVKVREKIELISKDGTKVENPYIKTDISEIGVSVPVYKIKEVPVKAEITDNVFGENDANIEVTPKTVVIKGSVDSVQSTEYIKTKAVSMKKINGSAVIETGYNMPDGVSLYGSSEKCEVKIDIYDYFEKTIVVPSEKIVLVNKNENMRYEIRTQNISVLLCGIKSDVEDINEDNISLEVDAASIKSGNNECSVKIDLGGRKAYADPSEKYIVNIFASSGS